MLEFFQMCDQFVLAGPADEVEADHLVGPLGRLFASPQADEHAGDDGTISLDFDSHRIVAQQVPTAQEMLEEPKEHFSVPFIIPPKITL